MALYFFPQSFFVLLLFFYVKRVRFLFFLSPLDLFVFFYIAYPYVALTQAISSRAVSYTHLTLPTIYSV